MRALSANLMSRIADRALKKGGDAIRRCKCPQGVQACCALRLSGADFGAFPSQTLFPHKRFV
jgi:hypothetical protein